MPRVVAIVLALVAWLVPQPYASAVTTSGYEAATVTAVNNARAAHNLRPLRPGPCVDRYAEAWARRIAETDNIVHRKQRVIARACNGRMVGEVIGHGFTLPAVCVGAWLLSPAHRDVILRPGYRRIGVGAVRDESGRWVVVANLIRH